MDGLATTLVGSDFAIVPSHLSSRPGLQKLRFRLFRDRGSSSLQFPAPFVTSALFSVSSVYQLIRFGCGCFILFLAWLVVDARVSSRHDPSPARFGLTPHMDLIPHLKNQVLLVREFPSCDRQLRQNCHGSLNSTPPRPTSSLSSTLLTSHIFELPFAFISSS